MLGALPATVCGYPLHAIVIDDGSSDDTTDRPRATGAAAVRLPLNRGQGAALRTGYRLALATGAEIVVSMDADGQHQPSELSRLVQPIADGEADVVNGSRVLGDADPSHAARVMGIRLFAQLLSLLTWSRVTDPACGYRAVRTQALRGLEFRQDQFHNSEFIVEVSKKHLRTIEVPVTVSTRLSGNSKKPPHFRYGMGLPTPWCAPGCARGAAKRGRRQQANQSHVRRRPCSVDLRRVAEHALGPCRSASSCAGSRPAGAARGARAA